MAPRNTLILFLLLSMILVGYASSPRSRSRSRARKSCQYYTNTECVIPKNCLSNNRRMKALRGCPRNKVCCETSFVYDDSPLPPVVDCGPNDVCLEPSMCDSPAPPSHLRSLMVQRRSNCPHNLICCNLDFMDHIYYSED